MARTRALAAALVALGIAGGVAVLRRPAAAEDAPAPPPARAKRTDLRLTEDPGTAVLGFGLLRVAPAKPGEPGTLRIRYEERPSDYAAFDAVQVIVLRGDAFEKDGRAFADAALAYARSASGAYEVATDVSVRDPGLWLVGYGPFSGPDAGRPLSLARAYALEVTSARGATWRFVDPEAGEWNVKGWTLRPEVERGGPTTDPVTGASHWFEARPLLFFDVARLRTEGDPPAPEVAAVRAEAAALRARAAGAAAAGREGEAEELRAEADDLARNLASSDDRVPLQRALATRLRRLPFRWK